MKKVCLLAVTAVLAVPASALADTTVDPSSSGTCARNGTCKTITDAIGVAQAGDTIKVLAGSYAENVNVPGGKDGLKIGFAPGSAVNGAASIASASVELTGLVLFRTAGTDAALTATGGKLLLADATIFSTTGTAITASG